MFRLLYAAFFTFTASGHEGKQIPLFSFWGIFLFLLAFRLQNRTEAAECLEQRLMKLRDDSTEKNLLLEGKKPVLAEKQDYETLCSHAERTKPDCQSKFMTMSGICSPAPS